MEVPFRCIGKDPASKNSDSPTAWIDERDHSLVMQGYEVEGAEEIAALVASSEHHHGLGVPAGETLIRWPSRMLPIFKEIVDALEHATSDGDAAEPR